MTMRAVVFVVGMVLAPAAAAAEERRAPEIAPPSGRTVTLADVVLEPESATARFRFLAPGLALDDYDAVAGDFTWLCERVALPALDRAGWEAGSVVVSLMSREVAFGATAPDVVQFFEAYAPEGRTCRWEPF